MSSFLLLFSITWSVSNNSSASENRSRPVRFTCCDGYYRQSLRLRLCHSPLLLCVYFSSSIFFRSASEEAIIIHFECAPFCVSRFCVELLRNVQFVGLWWNPCLLVSMRCNRQSATAKEQIKLEAWTIILFIRLLLHIFTFVCVISITNSYEPIDIAIIWMTEFIWWPNTVGLCLILSQE